VITHLSGAAVAGEQPGLAGEHVELIDAIRRLSLARSMAEVQEIVRGAARRLTGADGVTFVLRDGDWCHYVDEDAIAPLVGAIGSYWARGHRPTRREVTLLQALADSTAVALQNLRAQDELEQVRIESLQRLALAVELRDVGTHEHTARVARTSRRIAERLSLTESAAAWIGQAAPLHDVGKLSVPDSILLKPGRLTGIEFEQIKSHTTTGGAILAGSRSSMLQCAEEIARCHHEKWDGSGYPDGLRRDQIPVSARIVAVADVFDALTHARSYKPAWPAQRAMAEIGRLEGSHFDPEVVGAFRSLDCAALVDLVAA
jgi:response regulator RpfG family c-di-GMP phosphodiesterase